MAPLSVIQKCEMLLSCPAKKVTKERGLRRRYENAPSLRIHPPPRHPTHENVPIFVSLQGKNLSLFRVVGVQKSEHFWTPAGEAAQGFLQGWCSAQRSRIPMIAGGNHTTLSLAFSECPLKSPSFGTFLGEAVCQVKCNT